jgi:hypothetical protein
MPAFAPIAFRAAMHFVRSFPRRRKSNSQTPLCHPKSVMPETMDARLRA